MKQIKSEWIKLYKLKIAANIIISQEKKTKKTKKKNKNEHKFVVCLICTCTHVTYTHIHTCKHIHKYIHVHIQTHHKEWKTKKIHKINITLIKKQLRTSLLHAGLLF